MGSELRMGAFARFLLLLLALLVLADPSDAQKRKGGKGKGKGGKPQPPPGLDAGANTSFGGGTGFLPGFDAPAGGPKKGKGAPRGPSPKAAPKKPAAPPPPDPKTEADQVTATAEHQVEVDEAEQKFLREHFKVCDLDGNGWLSLRELEITLALPRDDYRRADANRDGRLDPREFAEEKTMFFARLGAQPRPAPKERKPEAPAGEEAAPPAEAAPDKTAKHKRPRAARSELEAIYPRPADLLARYDTDKSNGLDAAEIEKLLLEVGLTLSAEQLATSMDPDDSHQLEANELVGLAWMASQRLPESLRPERKPAQEEAPAAGPPPEDGAAEPETAQAAESKGPSLTHFGRLDADHDGFIGENDLRTLQNPARVDLRLAAVLSVLDRDRDGKLSPEEFGASMRPAKK